MVIVDPSEAFAVFDRQDSGCLSYGLIVDRRRLFIKTASTDEGRGSLRRAIVFHTTVEHPAIVAPLETTDEPQTVQLVYPWCDGAVLNHATTERSDRSALERFQRLPLDEISQAISTILDAHIAVVEAGFVAVDFYDGCLLYDFNLHQMHLIDLDEYRLGPFILTAERLPGSRRYMAPEEFREGAVIDERTTVFGLGRAIWNLLDSPQGWRGTSAQHDVAEAATQAEPGSRIPSVAALRGDWLRTGSKGTS